MSKKLDLVGVCALIGISFRCFGSGYFEEWEENDIICTWEDGIIEDDKLEECLTYPSCPDSIEFLIQLAIAKYQNDISN